MLFSYRMRLWLRGGELFSQSDALATLLGAFIGLIIGALSVLMCVISLSNAATPHGTVMSILIFLWMILMALTGMMNTSLLDILLESEINTAFRVCLPTPLKLGRPFTMRFAKRGR